MAAAPQDPNGYAPKCTTVQRGFRNQEVFQIPAVRQDQNMLSQTAIQPVSRFQERVETPTDSQDQNEPSPTTPQLEFLTQDTVNVATNLKEQNSISLMGLARQKSDQFMANLRMPLLLFTDEEADTLVYIEAAESEKAQQHRWAPLSQSNSSVVPQRMHSRKLLGCGSPVLHALFEPRKQSRVRRRYGLTNNMPPGITHTIDLTPPSEGDDAVIFMTELSCPLGVRKWAQYADTWRLPSVCVRGQDEVEWLTITEPEPDPQPLESLLPKKKNKKSPKKDKKKPAEKKVVASIVEEEKPPRVKKVPGLPLDYSPVRHRTCLERILHALEELNPDLDTPSKLWTFFALAKILGIAENPLVGDHIVAWLYAGNNPLFVEVNPELAYKMACGLKNSQLCQDSFAILVGEEALLLLNSSMQGQIPRRAIETLHGRTREHLDDTEIQRIEYASKAFLDRMLNAFVRLAGNEMLWLDNLVRRHINGNIEPRHNPIIDDFIKFCKESVRDSIYRVLRDSKTTRTPFAYPISADNGYPGFKYTSAMNNMPFICRILTRTFWKCLREDAAFLDKTNLQFFDHRHDSLKSLAPKFPNFKDQDNATIRWISGVEYLNTEGRFHAKANNLYGVENNFFPPEIRWTSDVLLHYMSDNPGNDNMVRFDTNRCRADIEFYIGQFADRAIRAFSEHIPRSDGVRFELVDTLVCLGDDELKFLPLWAGGNDDDTGGVFTDHDVPIVESGGFSTAGPSIHTGSTVPSQDSMSSFDSISPDDAASTVQRASHEATNSHATTVCSTSSTGSSGFEIVGGVQGMDIQSNPSIADDMGLDMSVPDESDEFSLDDFDDDDNDTIGESDYE